MLSIPSNKKISWSKIKNFQLIFLFLKFSFYVKLLLGDLHGKHV